MVLGLQPVVSADPSDPKLAHWRAESEPSMDAGGYRCGLHEGRQTPARILAVAGQHKRAGLAAVTGKHYEGVTGWGACGLSCHERAHPRSGRR